MHKLRKFVGKTLGWLDAPHRRSKFFRQQKLYSRSLRIESLEDRQMLAADIPHALFLPAGVNASDLGLTLGSGSSSVSAALTVVSESEPNNTIATADVVNLGFGTGEDDEVDVNGTIGGLPVAYFALAV